MNKTLTFVALVVAVAAAPAVAQPCRPISDTADRTATALTLVGCLGDPDPKVRDALAFERLSSQMRAGELEPRTLGAVKAALLSNLKQPAAAAILSSFSALTLAEVARTDRIKPWMSDAERQEIVNTAAAFLSGVRDYRAFSDREGFVHAVAHGADLALQLALNPAIDKPQLDRLLEAIATQIVPRDPSVAYWAGEPDRLARAALFIAQRKLHSDGEWKTWFATVMDPKPLQSWDVAFQSETGIRKRHNARAFLLSLFATASTSEDAGVKQLMAPLRDALKLVP